MAPPAHLQAIADISTLVPDEVLGHPLKRGGLAGRDLAAAGSISPGLSSLLGTFRRGPDDYSIAFAFDATSVTDLRVTAVRLRGVQADVLLDSWLTFAHDERTVRFSRRSVSGKAAVCVSTPGDPAWTCYVARDDVLFSAASGEFLLIREAIGAVP